MFKCSWLSTTVYNTCYRVCIKTSIFTAAIHEPMFAADVSINDITGVVNVEIGKDLLLFGFSFDSG
ncbi:MAG: hypothetical protein EBX37_18180 [Alphaproteobacteria bacterium]|nr:hypothetical protein [Alphaproteobacteria bacterium]